MPTYRVNRDTLVPHTGRVHRAGETVEIDWPNSADGTSSEPTRLDSNLTLVEADDEDAGDARPAKGRRGQG